MSTADRAAPETSLATSMLRIVLVGLALVFAVTGAFWAIGRTGDGGDAPVIAEPTDAATTDGPEPEDAATETLVASPVPSELETPTTTPEATPTATATATATEAVVEGDPADITIQVLDAAGDDGAAAEDAAERLREAGFQVVAVNEAVRTYGSSTLFYTEGHVGDAQFVAQEFSQFDVIDEAPSNLSSEVDVHAVIGEDWFASGD